MKTNFHFHSGNEYTIIFYKHIFYKNVEAEIDPDFKNTLRTPAKNVTKLRIRNKHLVNVLLPHYIQLLLHVLYKLGLMFLCQTGRVFEVSW